MCKIAQFIHCGSMTAELQCVLCSQHCVRAKLIFVAVQLANTVYLYIYCRCLIRVYLYLSAIAQNILFFIHFWSISWCCVSIWYNFQLITLPKKLDHMWARCCCHPTPDEHVGLSVHPSGCHQINALLPNLPFTPPPSIHHVPAAPASVGSWHTCTFFFIFFYLLSASKRPFTSYFLDGQTCTVLSYGISASR